MGVECLMDGGVGVEDGGGLFGIGNESEYAMMKGSSPISVYWRSMVF